MTYEQYLTYAETLRGVQPYTRKQWASLSSVHKHMIGVDARRRGVA